MIVRRIEPVAGTHCEMDLFHPPVAFDSIAFGLRQPLRQA
jgi:hypothetical protein